MKTTKIWVGVGAFVLASGMGSPNATGVEAPVPSLRADRTADTAVARVLPGTFVLAQHMKHDGEVGEVGEKGPANLPPDLAFAHQVALIRGHLLIGDELVKAGQWKAAFPHFLHPTEEIYGKLKGSLATYDVPSFEAALKLLSDRVKNRKGGDDYAKAWKTVADALAVAESKVLAKQTDRNRFTLEAALEVLKTSSGEYEEAIQKGRIAKPVEYQDARGFIWYAESMIEGIAPALEQKDAASLKAVRAGLADLKKTFPTAMPPKKPVKDYGSVLADISRIELAASHLR